MKKRKKSGSELKMNCPTASVLEDLVAGRLDQEQQEGVVGHVSRCDKCSKEVAFLKATSLLAPSVASDRDCVSDEVLCAYVDDALDEQERKRVLAHVSRCESCSANLANLVRSLDEIVSDRGQPLMAPPVALLNRAIRIGATGKSASEKKQNPGGFFSIFASKSLALRMAFAGSVAGAVILVVVASGPVRKPSGDEMMDAGLRAWSDQAIAVSKKPVVKTPEVASQVHDDKEAGEATSTVSGSVKPGHPDSIKEAPSTSTIASLSLERRSALAKSLAPTGSIVPSMSKALSDTKHGSVNGYGIGRAIGFLESFGSSASQSSELRSSTLKALSSLEVYIQGSSSKELVRLKAFISGLTKGMESGKMDSTKLSSRIKVLCSALRQVSEKNRDVAPGVRLGILVQEWATRKLANERSDSDAIKRAREIIRSGALLTDSSRKSVLENMDKLQQAARIKEPEKRTQRILEELRNLDTVFQH